MLREPPVTNYYEIEQRLRLISPAVLATLGMSSFLLAWLFPPNLFERILGEKSYVFLDPRTFAFNFSCYACVLFGIYLAKFFRNRQERLDLEDDEHDSHVDRNREEVGTRPPLSRFAMVLFLGGSILAGAISMAMTAQNVGVGNLAKAMFTGGYRVLVRQQLESETLGLGSLTPLMLPCFGIALGLASTLTHRKWRFALILFAIAFAAFLVPTALFARRTILLRPLFGMVLVGILFTSYRMKRVVPLILFVSLFFAMLTVTVFSAFSVVRMETVSAEQQVNDFTRYLVTSYNNEAMFLQGKMDWDGEGRGYYWTQFIWTFPFVTAVIDLDNIREKYLGIRAPHGHLERVKILRQHGVRSSTNISAFGSSYIDFGILGCLPFMITGFVLQSSFQSFVRNRVFGMVVFPYIAWAALDWRGNLMFPGPGFGYAIILLGICYVLGILFPARRVDPTDGSEIIEDDDDEYDEYEEEDQEDDAEEGEDVESDSLKPRA